MKEIELSHCKGQLKLNIGYTLVMIVFLVEWVFVTPHYPIWWNALVILFTVSSIIITVRNEIIPLRRKIRKLEVELVKEKLLR